MNMNMEEKEIKQEKAENKDNLEKKKNSECEVINGKKNLKKDKVEIPVDEFKELKKKAEERDIFWDKYLRICADFDNARKRWEKDRTEIIKFANFNILKELIMIVDELEQAISYVEEGKNTEEIVKGLRMIHDNFVRFLEKQGVEKIEAEGKVFDPHLHEIVGQKEEDKFDLPTVIQEIQKGYKFNDKVLRTAKVIVGINISKRGGNNE